MELQYDAAGLYNGNIGQMSWKNVGDGATGIVQEQSYDFTYDKLNRLKIADYNSNGTLLDHFNVTGNDSGIAYDLNGNIENLQRNLRLGSCPHEPRTSPSISVSLV